MFRSAPPDVIRRTEKYRPIFSTPGESDDAARSGSRFLIRGMKKIEAFLARPEESVEHAIYGNVHGRCRCGTIGCVGWSDARFLSSLDMRGSAPTVGEGKATLLPMAMRD